MLIPSTNVPIRIEFDNSVESYRNLVATLWISGKMMKRWDKVDGTMVVMGDAIELPLTEDETRKYKKGKAKLLIKGLNFMNKVVFYEEAMIQIDDREDKVIDLIGEA